MRIIERPDIKGSFVPCVKCGSGTRSHVLESAEYEEYEEVWEDDDLQEYQGRKKKVDEEEEEEKPKKRKVGRRLAPKNAPKRRQVGRRKKTED